MLYRLGGVDLLLGGPARIAGARRKLSWPGGGRPQPARSAGLGAEGRSLLGQLA